ncbi:MAG: hypothetical protein ACLFPF_09435 [Halanaerobiales bacterium]
MFDDRNSEKNNEAFKNREKINSDNYEEEDAEDTGRAQGSRKEDNQKENNRRINVGDFVLEMNHIKMPNPVSLVRRLYELRSNESMTKEEKEKELVKITKEFTR